MNHTAIFYTLFLFTVCSTNDSIAMEQTTKEPPLWAIEKAKVELIPNLEATLSENNDRLEINKSNIDELLTRAKSGDKSLYQKILQEYAYGLFNTQVREKVRTSSLVKLENYSNMSIFELLFAFVTLENIPNEFLSAVMDLANKEDPLALYILGNSYRDGSGVEEDKAQGAFFIEKSASLGYPRSQYTLGELYINGEGVPQDILKSKEWYEKAAANGCIWSLNELGNLHHSVMMPHQDYSAAVDCYERAAAAGSDESLYNLGLLYYSCPHFAGSHSTGYEKAVGCFERAAESGINESLHYLGCAYAYGKGVSQDYTKAREFFEKALTLNILWAEYELGRLYLEGNGVPQDCPRAIELFEKAADGGDVDAQYQLGRLYLYGINIPKDIVKAREFMEKAAASGESSAAYELMMNPDLNPRLVWPATEIGTTTKIVEAA